MNRVKSVDLFLLQLVVYLFAVVSFNAQAAFTKVATHPEASLRYYTGSMPAPYSLSRYGREIKVLRAFNNRLYIGYGQDDGPNKPGTCTPYYVSSSGAPWCELAVRYYSPSTGLSAPQAYFRSQEIDTIEVLNGNLYILAEDREGSADYVKCTTTQCSTGSFDNGTSGHIYSATALNGAIFMAGAAYPDDGAVWKSTDNGNYWTVSLQVPPEYGYNYFVRAYHVGGPYNGKLYSTPRDSGHGSEPYTRRYNGSSWSIINNPGFDPSARRMRQFAGKLVYIYGSKLREYNGTNVVNSNYSPNIIDFTINGEWLYVLNTGTSFSTISRTKDLAHWHYVDTAPTDAISIEVLNESVYVGTTDSEIHRSNANLDDPKTTMPPIYLLLLND